MDSKIPSGGQKQSRGSAGADASARQLHERLDAADVNLLVLESDPKNEDALRAIGRAFDAVRDYTAGQGGAQTFALLVQAQRLLDGIRAGHVDTDGPAIDTLFDVVGVLRRVIFAANSSVELDEAIVALCGQLRSLSEGVDEQSAAPRYAIAFGVHKRLGELLIDSGVATPQSIEAALRDQQALPQKRRVGDILVDRVKVTPAQLQCALDVQKMAPGHKLGDILIAMKAVGEGELESALRQQDSPEKTKLGEALVRSGQVSAKAVGQTIRSQDILRKLIRYGLADSTRPAPSEGALASSALDTAAIREFAGRSNDHLKAAEIHLLTLESDPANEEALGAVQRTFYSSKWVARYLGLSDIAGYAREAELLLDAVRNDEIELSGTVIDAAFDAVTQLQELVVQAALAAERGELPPHDDRLTAWTEDIQSVTSGAKRVPLSATPMIAYAAPNKKLGEILIESGVTSAEGIETALRAQQVEPKKKLVGDILVEQVKVSRTQLDHALEIQRQDPSRRMGDILVEMGAADPCDIEVALKHQQAPQKPKLGEALVRSGQAPAKAVAQTIRSQGIVRNLLRFGLSAIGMAGDSAKESEAPAAEQPVYVQADPKQVRDFIARAADHLAAADVHLLHLESDAKDKAALDAVLRGFYTIKWMSEYIGLNDITAYAREAERLVDRARNRKIELSGPALDAAFDAVEMLRRLVRHVSNALESGIPIEPEPRLKDSIDYLKAVAAGEKILPFRPLISDAAAGKKLGEILIEAGITTAEDLESALREQQAAAARRMVGDILIDQIKLSRAQLDRALELQKQDPSKKLGDLLIEMGAVEPEDIEAALEEQRKRQAPKLGEILIRSGRASAKAVAHAIRTQSIINDLLKLGLTAAMVTMVLGASPMAQAAAATSDGSASVVSVVADDTTDTDSDGLPDVVENALGTDAALADTDGDLILDAWEVEHGLNANDSNDADQDQDSDGLTNLDEYQAGTDPFSADTDGDAWSDAIEAQRGTDGASADSKPVPSVAADVNADNKVDALDVQMVTNAALGEETPVPTDVNKVGGTNALDVQAVINAALGH
ncbi:MAG: Hpt domain-containing protein [Candidatus Hydrogenedentes bacterium]|nr:Hpt domain-containing protein [Candidatus Hydrogenedentota bacterium]